MGIDRKKGKKNEMWILRRVKWDKVCGGGGDGSEIDLVGEQQLFKECN